MTWSHEGHDIRCGPVVDFRMNTKFVCITCRIAGEGPYELLKGAPPWTDQDYYDNADWIEA